MQLSLVAFYGTKTARFADCIAHCQRLIAAELGERFVPYAVDQVHATLVGLEREVLPQARFANRNEWRITQRVASMDFDGFVRTLRTDLLPFNVQLGGFPEDFDEFLSRGQRPFERSFSVQGDKAVLMGWPCGDHRGALDALRQRALEHNVRHAYLQRPGDRDDDLFMRLGLVERASEIPGESIESVCRTLRRALANQPPIELPLRVKDVSFAAYDDERLPRENTRVLSLADPALDGAELAALY